MGQTRHGVGPVAIPLRCTTNEDQTPTDLHGPLSGAVDSTLLQRELGFKRALSRHPQLSIFCRNTTTWEVLLIIALEGGDEGPGLYELIARVETRALGQSALLRFLRERRDEGSIRFERNPLKQSKWSLSLREDLREDLMGLLHQRSQGQGR